jgi:alkanesulfonate monooxygenase SsuD/methylene tetrahydromethanopterin reductase-like flavin-dependent oxidoreductase (luciferase family)
MSLNRSLQARQHMFTANAMKLGLFSVNASSGRLLTVVPERWSASWADNVALAEMADAAGLDFLLPIARWKGYGGQTNSQGTTFETLTWCTAISALTTRITVFATVHAPLVNPVAAAKALVTADHAGGGRMALNIVVGWNEDEFGMFGVPQRPAEERYPYAQEWIDAVKRIWTAESPFDFDGTYLKMKNVEGNPKLIGSHRPLMMNAGASAAGRAYAIDNCDALFTDTARKSFADVAEVVRSFKEEARVRNREIEIYSDGLVICRPTQREAEDYFQHALVDNADWGAIELKLDRKGIRRDNTSREEYEQRRNAWAHGMGGRNIIGDPDSVAQQLADLHGAGLRGMAMNFVNFLDELPYFRDEVLPRLARLGLRSEAVVA